MPLSPERPCCTGHASTPTVGLVVDRMDWHAREIAAALAARGFGTAPIRLHLCGIATQNASGLHIDGFGERLPDAVIVRSMSGGTFEAVTLRLGILHALRECGVMVWNDARAIERCVDKSTTSFLLARAGITTPPTWAVEFIRSGPRHRASRDQRSSFGAQAIVWFAGTWAAPHPQAG